MSSWANPCSWEPKDGPWGRERSEHVLRPTCAVQTNSPWLSQAIGTREHIFRQEESSAEMLVWGPSLSQTALSLLHECKLTVKKEYKHDAFFNHVLLLLLLLGTICCTCKYNLCHWLYSIYITMNIFRRVCYPQERLEGNHWCACRLPTNAPADWDE